MRNCKYEKRYPHTKKHIKCTKDGSLRRKNCWLTCPHATRPLWTKILRRLYSRYYMS